jgi:hypothetical protein
MPFRSQFRRFGTLGTAALAFVLGSALPAQTITSIGLTVVPPDAGRAHVVYAPGGLVRGGHLSGDSVPFVHQAEGRVAGEPLVALWRAARALGESLLARQDSIPAGGRGYLRLDIERRGRAPAVIVWPFGTEHPDRRVRELVTLVMAHRVGGW